MGGISDFIFGSKSKQDSSSQSSSSSQSGNQAFSGLSKALSPTLGYGAQAGSMIASLLGIPVGLMHGGAPSYQDNYTYDPASGEAGGGSGGSTAPSSGGVGLGSLFGQERLPHQNAPIEATGKFNSDGGYSPQGLLNEQPQGFNDGTPASASGVSPADATSGLDNFANSAGMDFMRDQGVKAIEASQAGKGMLQSGATGQALSTFGNNLGKTYLNDYLSHLMDYAGLGTKNAAVLGSSGNTSSSTGLSFGSGSGVGGKNGLLNNIIAAF